MIDAQLLNILACPVTKAPVSLSKDKTELICTASRLAYPIRDGIPVMLESEARHIAQDEYEALKKAGL
ncbi:Trm112 family protein [Salinispirillum marinum]